MPASQVMSKFKKGKLHSGSKHGPKVTNPKQAIAIKMSEAREEDVSHNRGKETKGQKMSRTKRMEKAKL